MNDINDVINSYAIDLEKALKTIQQLEKENADLKSKLANIKYLDRQEVEKIFKVLFHSLYLCPESSDERYIAEAITAICSLAIEIDKEKIVKVLEDFTSTLECSKCGKHITDIIVSESFDFLATEIIKEIEND